jgi:hypothetical protein
LLSILFDRRKEILMIYYQTILFLEGKNGENGSQRKHLLLLSFYIKQDFFADNKEFSGISRIFYKHFRNFRNAEPFNVIIFLV